MKLTLSLIVFVSVLFASLADVSATDKLSIVTVQRDIANSVDYLLMKGINNYSVLKYDAITNRSFSLGHFQVDEELIGMYIANYQGDLEISVWGSQAVYLLNDELNTLNVYDYSDELAAVQHFMSDGSIRFENGCDVDDANANEDIVEYNCTSTAGNNVSEIYSDPTSEMYTYYAKFSGGEAELMLSDDDSLSMFGAENRSTAIDAGNGEAFRSGINCEGYSYLTHWSAIGEFFVFSVCEQVLADGSVASLLAYVSGSYAHFETISSSNWQFVLSGGNLYSEEEGQITESGAVSDASSIMRSERSGVIKEIVILEDGQLKSYLPVEGVLKDVTVPDGCLVIVNTPEYAVDGQYYYYCQQKNGQPQAILYSGF